MSQGSSSVPAPPATTSGTTSGTTVALSAALSAGAAVGICGESGGGANCAAAAVAIIAARKTAAGRIVHPFMLILPRNSLAHPPRDVSPRSTAFGAGTRRRVVRAVVDPLLQVESIPAGSRPRAAPALVPAPSGDVARTGPPGAGGSVGAEAGRRAVRGYGSRGLGVAGTRRRRERRRSGASTRGAGRPRPTGARSVRDLRPDHSTRA